MVEKAGKKNRQETMAEATPVWGLKRSSTLPREVQPCAGEGGTKEGACCREKTGGAH